MLSFDLLKHDADDNDSHNGKNWAMHVKTLLEQHGYGYIWQQQNEFIVPYLEIKQCIYDT